MNQLTYKRYFDAAKEAYPSASGVIRPPASVRFSRKHKSVFTVLSKTDFQVLKDDYLNKPETVFTFPTTSATPKIQNKTIDELQDVLFGMVQDVCKENPAVKIYSTPNFTQNTNKKPSPEQKSLVFVNDILHFPSYPYSVEISDQDLKNNNHNVQNILPMCRFFESNEGTVIRVFNVEGKWYTATNKKIDAFTSKWASKRKTFGIHLANSLSKMFGHDLEFDDLNPTEQIQIARNYVNDIWDVSLDVTKKYFFLLKSSDEERIVCTSEDALLNIGTLDETNKLTLDDDVELCNTASKKVTVSKPKERVFKDIQELLSDLNKLDPYKCPGFLGVFVKNLSEENIEHDIFSACHVKIVNPEYNKLAVLRGNTPSLRFRLIQLNYLQNKELQLKLATKVSYVDEFVNLYPNNNLKQVFNYIWEVVVKDLFEKYLAIFVNKTETNSHLTPKIEATLSQIHYEYLESKEKTTMKRINDILNLLEPTVLNQLIKEYETNERFVKKALLNIPLPAE